MDYGLELGMRLEPDRSMVWENKTIYGRYKAWHDRWCKPHAFLKFYVIWWVFYFIGLFTMSR